MTTFALAAFVLAAFSAPAWAAEDQTKFVEPVPQTLKVTEAGIGQTQSFQGFSEMTGLPSVAEIESELPEEGLYYGWIDEDGNRLDLTREGEDILIRGESRPTARLRVTELSGLGEASFVTQTSVTED